MYASDHNSLGTTTIVPVTTSSVSQTEHCGRTVPVYSRADVTPEVSDESAALEESRRRELLLYEEADLSPKIVRVHVTS